MTDVVTNRYERIPFEVDAVQVTASNMAELAVWTGGEIHPGRKQGNRVMDYIQIDAHNPVNERQSKAYVNDWILKSGQNFKVYPDKAFTRQFRPVEDSVEPEIHSTAEKLVPADSPVEVRLVEKTEKDSESLDDVLLKLLAKRMLKDGD